MVADLLGHGDRGDLDIKKIGVVGCGIMGAGIVQALEFERAFIEKRNSRNSRASDGMSPLIPLVVLNRLCGSDFSRD